MRFVRYKKGTDTYYGIVKGDAVDELKGDIFSRYELTGRRYPFDELKMLAPCQPTKIIALGLNYRSHAEELKMKLPEEPLLFLKPSTAVIAQHDNIIYPAMSHRVDYEAELGVVVAKEAKDISEDKAEDYIFGYTCLTM